jgi:hypothetical protein
MEFCPLCNKRMAPYGLITRKSVSTTSEISNTDLSIYDNNSNILSFNLFDNKVNSDIKEYFEDLTSDDGYGLMLIVRKECKKYHFYYSAFAVVNFIDWTIKEITIDKCHFVRHQGGTHFVINSDYIDDSTTIRLTSNCKTRELKLPFVDFDLSSIKKIDKKLRNIELLG